MAGKEEEIWEEELGEEEYLTESMREASKIIVTWCMDPDPVNFEPYDPPSLFIKGHLSVVEPEDPEPVEFKFTSLSGDISKWILLASDVSIQRERSGATTIDFGKTHLGRFRIWRGFPRRRRNRWVH